MGRKHCVKRRNCSLQQDSFFSRPVHCFDNDYVEKQPVAWKKYCAEYCLTELKEFMDSCTGHCNITEILFKAALNSIQSINY